MDNISKYRDIAEVNSAYGGGKGSLEDPFRPRIGADLREFAKEVVAKWGNEKGVYIEGHMNQIFSITFVKSVNGSDVSFEGTKNKIDKSSYTKEEIEEATHFSSLIGQGLSELLPTQ